MDKLKAQILELLGEDKKVLHKIYARWLDDHAYLWEEFDDLERLREVLLVMVKLFYHEHKQLKDINKVDYEEFKKSVMELLTNKDSILEKARKAQIDEIEFFGPERWFEIFKKDIDNINQIIGRYDLPIVYKTERGVPIVDVTALIPRINQDGFWTSDTGIGNGNSPAMSERKWEYMENKNVAFRDNYQQKGEYVLPMADYRHTYAQSEAKFKEETQRLKGQILVDLGAGVYLFGYFAAGLAGCKGYIAVEYNNARKSWEYLHGWIKRGDSDLKIWEQFKKRIPMSIISEDMLSFLRRLPDNSVSILASGIDSYIIPDNSYRKLVEAEIFRVLDPNGAALVFQSDLFDSRGEPDTRLLVHTKSSLQLLKHEHYAQQVEPRVWVHRMKIYPDQVAHAKGMKQWLAVKIQPRTVGDKVLDYSVIDGEKLKKNLPYFWEFGLKFHGTAESLWDGPLVLLPEQSAINMNFVGPGEQQGFHTDRNEVTILLYLTTPKGGALEYKDSKGDLQKILAEAGKVVALVGANKILHRVAPVEEGEERIALVASFGLPGKNYANPKRDNFLYTNDVVKDQKVFE